MKHLIVNDIHGQQRWLDQILEMSAGMESVILSMDLIDMHDDTETEAEKVLPVDGIRVSALNFHIRES